MSDPKPDIVDQAICWHLRLPAATEQEWLRFTAWLEADDAHAAAYDRIVEDDILAAPMLDLREESRASVARARRNEAAWRRRGGWMLGAGAALAASLAAVVLLPPGGDDAAAPRAIVTRPGERRTVALDDGSQVELNGGTELTVEDPRRVALARGQATFHIRHDARRPFQLAMGDVVLRDVGTVFDVSREEGRLAVKVAEGSVLYQPEREGLTLHRGMALTSREGDDRIVVRRVAAESVGGWRQGRLAFRETPLREVAAEIRRTTGHPIAVAAAVAETPFTGAVRLAGDPATDAAHVASLAGLQARRSGTGWILASVGDAPD